MGPATDEPGMIRRILQMGVNVIRINLSHGLRAAHLKRIEITRSEALDLGLEIGILLDLQGPKIRITRFKNGFVHLMPGNRFTLDAALDPDEGTVETVGIDYKNLPNDVVEGDSLLLDDGLLVLEVRGVEGTKIHCEVKLGGKLSNHKGINRKGGGLSAPALTDKDRADIEFAAKMNVDYVAVSFPRNANDIEEARALLEKDGGRARIIAKIERVEAVQALDDIIRSADAVMVARGDLGVEIGYAELPAIQKHIISRARALNKVAVTATQMMESMIHSPIPTRAEVSDVANAVIDGTDAVMLSAETAMGEFPDKVVEAMAGICLAAERHKSMHVSNHRLECRFDKDDEALAMAAMYTANHIQTSAIVALTESGSTPLWMSRIRSGIPIYGLSRSKESRGRMTLFRGVYPVDFDVTRYPKVQVTNEAIAELLRMKVIKIGDRVIITKGDIMGHMGGANTLKIVRVEEKMEEYI